MRWRPLHATCCTLCAERAPARSPCSSAPPQGDKWVIYNDSKVAVSEKPPLELGYLYFFKRADVE